MARLKYMKYGGVKFKPLVSPREINSYVRNLPVFRRESMFEVAKELQDHGMIEVLFDEEMVSKGLDSCL